MSRIPSAELIKHYEYDPSTVERIAHRRIPMGEITISEYDPEWPARFEEHKTLIVNAVSDRIISIAHTGSTSIPGCPAKPIIDIDLVVKDIHDESSYIPQLEKAGYRFLLREPRWMEHRYLVHDVETMFPCQIHVFPDNVAEPERHRIFREWLKSHPEDLERYANVKRQSAEEANAHGEDQMGYNQRKEYIIREILDRAFKSLGHT
ncbi:grpb/dephospho-CoA kinase [Kockovaella imperatae]|uniref:Grpb/dephospho-CoA kinase n=1 Tax=Kockovaella imperatae TaxID=4999 RepID=A0A1Y1URV1_9TREE|nr:grpb/dephospho-CoA kinase [Kockovaella imperatae]ORX40771.1 grpb/dephospho-CoA kinase [Kockovaella imperatae]